MIDAATGFAPGRWQSHVGPVVVWRATFQPFSSDDFWLVQDFLTNLLDKYADSAVQLSRDVTPEAFQKSKRRSLSYERLNQEDVQQSEDVNI